MFVLVVAFVDLSFWLALGVSRQPTDPEPGSPSVVAALGSILAALGIWLTLGFVNRWKRPSARLCAGVVLVISLGVLSVGLSVWLTIWIPYQREQQALRKMSLDGLIHARELSGPEWLRRILGDDQLEEFEIFDRVVYLSMTMETTEAQLAHLGAFTHLRELDLSNYQVTDASLAGVSRLKNLKELTLSTTQVTGAGLVHLSGLINLESLELYQTRVTDAGLVHLRGLVKLKRLNLWGTRVTDAGLAHLRGLTKLESLDLQSTKITDAGLAQLSRLTNLEALMVDDTQLTDAGLAHLSRLTNLKRLSVGPQISDAGLAHLRGLSKLEGLHLIDTVVTDAGLSHLSGMTNLKRLYLTGTAVTDAGLGDTHQEVRISGSTVFTNPGGAPVTQPGGLLALPTNIGNYSRDVFTVIPQININVGRQVTDRLRIFVGYNFMYWSNVVRPGDQIDPVVNPTQLPTSTGPGTLVGPARPAFAFHDTGVWLQGVSLGLGYSW